MEDTMAQFLAMAAGFILSLVFEFFPGVSTWFDTKSKTFKQLFMGGLMLVVGAGIVGASCAGILASIFPELVVTCDLPGILGVFMAWVAAFGANQLTHVTVNKFVNSLHGK